MSKASEQARQAVDRGRFLAAFEPPVIHDRAPTTGVFWCDRCGAVIYAQDAHVEWHEAITETVWGLCETLMGVIEMIEPGTADEFFVGDGPVE